MFITPKKVPSQYQGNSWDGSIPAVKEKMCKNTIYDAWNQRMQYINGYFHHFMSQGYGAGFYFPILFLQWIFQNKEPIMSH